MAISGGLTVILKSPGTQNRSLMPISVNLEATWLPKVLPDFFSPLPMVAKGLIWFDHGCQRDLFEQSDRAIAGSVVLSAYVYCCAGRHVVGHGGRGTLKLLHSEAALGWLNGNAYRQLLSPAASSSWAGLR